MPSLLEITHLLQRLSLPISQSLLQLLRLRSRQMQPKPAEAGGTFLQIPFNCNNDETPCLRNGLAHFIYLPIIPRTSCTCSPLIRHTWPSWFAYVSYIYGGKENETISTVFHIVSCRPARCLYFNVITILAKLLLSKHDCCSSLTWYLKVIFPLPLNNVYPWDFCKIIQILHACTSYFLFLTFIQL